MSVIGGRGGRHDDWSSDHARAQARSAERLDGPLDADEAAWLDNHLAGCADCAAIARDYAAQRLELRALREPTPVPPRDLWARTAAAIESESRHGSRSRGSRHATLRPFALLAGALVVAIAVGVLTSSQLPFGGVTTTPGTSQPPAIALGTPTPDVAAPTPLAVWLSSLMTTRWCFWPCRHFWRNGAGASSLLRVFISLLIGWMRRMPFPVWSCRTTVWKAI